MRHAAVIFLAMLVAIMTAGAGATEISLGVFPTGNTIGHKYFDGVLFRPVDLGKIAEITSVKMLQDGWVIKYWEEGQPFPAGIHVGSFDWSGVYLLDVWLSIYFGTLTNVEVILSYQLKPEIEEAEFWYIASDKIKDEVTVWLTRAGAEPARQVVFAKLAPAEEPDPYRQQKDEVLNARRARERQTALTTAWGKIKNE